MIWPPLRVVSFGYFSVVLPIRLPRLRTFSALPFAESSQLGCMTNQSSKWTWKMVTSIVAHTNPKRCRCETFTPQWFHSFASHSGYAEEGEMTYLLEQGCKANAPQWNGITPLYIAIPGSKQAFARLLLNAGAGRNQSIENKYRAIRYAPKCTHW